ncbi:MAG TPA: VCBS repeat-containing protein [Actinomycetota bacterium]|nr:VCBS repeat-containing protein [Actinomycetota bacterium]
MGAHRLVHAALALALVATGCDGDSGSAAPDARDVGSPASSPTPTTDSSPTPAASPTLAPGDPCPPSNEPALPDDAGCVSVVEGDLDGDGRADRLFVFALVDGDGHARAWRARAEVGGETVAGPHFHRKAHTPHAIAAVDADGDGADEVFVKVSDHLYHSGASHIVGVLKLHDGALVQVVERGHGPMNADVGGVTRFGEGVECADGARGPELRVLRTEAANDAYTRWDWSRKVYRWHGASLVYVETRRGTLKTDGYNDPDRYRFYRLECRGVVYPELG